MARTHNTCVGMRLEENITQKNHILELQKYAQNTVKILNEIFFYKMKQTSLQ